MEPRRDQLSSPAHLSQEAAALYVDALLRQDLSSLSEETRSHVESCPACKDSILDIYGFLSAADEQAPAAVLPDFIRAAEAKPPLRLVPLYLRRAAAVFFFLTLFLSLYFLLYRGGDFTPGDVETGPPAGEQVSVEEGVKADPAGVDVQRAQGDSRPVVEEGFRVNPNLEAMIDGKFRSVAVQVISPRNRETYGRDIVFSWKNFKKKPLTLKILNNRSRLLFQYDLEAGENRFDFKEKLKPGLYYWKLECRQDLLYVGNFYIRQ
jgi:hypothetical protein